MTREETVKIIRIMCDCYPNYKPNDLSETVDVWTMMLEEYPYEQIAVSLKAYVLSDTSGFAPSIGQLVAKVQDLSQPQELTELEAWALVHKAIKNSSYESEEEFAKLPPLVQKAVGLPSNLREWALTENLNKEVVSSNFMRTYKNVVNREKEFNKLPSDAKQLIKSSMKGSYSDQIEDKRQRTIKSLSDESKLKIDALDEQRECIPMPRNIKKRLGEFRNEQSKKATY